MTVNVEAYAHAMKQATGAIFLAGSDYARRRMTPNQIEHHLAMACEWLSGLVPLGWPEDWVFGWFRDQLRLRNVLRRRNAGGGWTESFLAGEKICTRVLPPRCLEWLPDVARFTFSELSPTRRRK